MYTRLLGAGTQKLPMSIVTTPATMKTSPTTITVAMTPTTISSTEILAVVTALPTTAGYPRLPPKADDNATIDENTSETMSATTRLYPAGSHDQMNTNCYHFICMTHTKGTNKLNDDVMNPTIMARVSIPILSSTNG